MIPRWLYRILGHRLDPRTEIGRAIRYAIVGVSLAVLYSGLYALFRGAGMAAWAASLVGFLICVAVQYFAHTLFTFRSPLRAPGQVPRFVASVTLGALLATTITGLIGPAARLPEAASLGIVLVLIPISNFLMFRIWVYREIDTRAPATGKR